MRSLSASEIVRVWEAGLAQSPLERALTMLNASVPESSREEWARLGIGDRDAQLFALREKTLGPELEALVECAKCGNRLEIALRTAELCPAAPAENLDMPRLLEIDGYEVRVRLPNSFDLAEAARMIEADVPHALLRRCIESVHRDSTKIAFEALPARVLDLIGEQMNEIDPRAEIELLLHCPECAHEWTQLFDIASFFWGELAARTQRLLRSVHALASAYGWREAEILGLSEQRRQFYLEAIGA